MDKKKRRIEMIPIDRINFLNPRVRNQKIFNDIAHNITQVGLKRPITVAPCVSKTPDKDYDLVCGQGRLETFIACGRKEIPAIIVEVTEEEALLMSLAENMARLQRRPLELLQGIELLKKKGYSGARIAEKTGMTPSYVSDILKLLEHGEERLVVAVESGHMPIRLALDIATAPDDEQRALQEAYESKQLWHRRSQFDAHQSLARQITRYTGELKTALTRLNGYFGQLAAEGHTVVAFADHGQVPQKISTYTEGWNKIHTDDVVRMPSGGAGRVRWSYPREGKEDYLQQQLQSLLGESAMVIRRDELDSLGILRLGDNLKSQIGEIITFALTDDYPLAVHGGGFIYEHGSVTPDEMLVPLMVYQGAAKEVGNRKSPQPGRRKQPATRPAQSQKPIR
jgi:ParB family chromosome partitioning protein